MSGACYRNRLHNIESNQLAKKIFCDLAEIDQQDFNTRVIDTLKLANDLGLEEYILCKL